MLTVGHYPAGFLMLIYLPKIVLPPRKAYLKYCSSSSRPDGIFTPSHTKKFESLTTPQLHQVPRPRKSGGDVCRA